MAKKKSEIVTAPTTPIGNPHTATLLFQNVVQGDTPIDQALARIDHRGPLVDVVVQRMLEEYEILQKVAIVARAAAIADRDAATKALEEALAAAIVPTNTALGAYFNLAGNVRKKLKALFGIIDENLELKPTFHVSHKDYATTSYTITGDAVAVMRDATRIEITTSESGDFSPEMRRAADDKADAQTRIATAEREIAHLTNRINRPEQVRLTASARVTTLSLQAAEGGSEILEQCDRAAFASVKADLARLHVGAAK